MLRAILAAVALFAAAPVTPAAAQAMSEERFAADLQAAMAQAGAWSQEYLAVQATAVGPLSQIDQLLSTLDRFNEGKLRAPAAIAELEAWRDRAGEQIAAARLAAEALPPPPPMARFGPEGARMEMALSAARDDALPLVHEFNRLTQAVSEMAIDAIRNPGKGVEVRLRAMLQAAVQLVRVDLRRVRITVAALPDTHPNHALMTATEVYFESLIATPVHVLETMDGGGDRAALVTAMREHAVSIRVAIQRGETNAAQLRREMEAASIGPMAAIARTVLRAGQTYPGSFRAFAGLAANLELVANRLEAGDDPMEVWSDAETLDRPHLDEIERLEAERVRILANSTPAL